MHQKQERIIMGAIQSARNLLGSINDMVGNGLDGDYTLADELERFIREQEQALAGGDR